jgi:hypothetical protein
MAWIMLRDALAAAEGLPNADGTDETNFYRSKIQTVRFYFNYIFPKVSAHKRTLLSTDRVTLNTGADLLV